MNHPDQSAKNDLLHKLYIEKIKKHAYLFWGRVLDIGCGQMPYIDLFWLSDRENYIGIDVVIGQGKVRASGESIPFKDATFDSAVCLQTLEHVKEPKRLLSEAYRVLRPNGRLLLTVPFMWGIHSEPHDYFRYTRYGLEYLANAAGFIVERIEADSGFWLLWALRLNYYLSRLETKLLNPLFWLVQRIGAFLDRLDVKYNRRDTVGYTVILLKP